MKSTCRHCGQFTQRSPIAQRRLVVVAQRDRQRLRVDGIQHRQAFVALGADPGDEVGEFFGGHASE